MTALSFGLALLSAGCMDPFATEPLDRIVDSTVWQEESLMRAYITELYSTFPFSPFPTRDNGLVQAAGETFGGTPTPSATNDAQGFWNYSYIRDLNVFLAGVATSRASDAAKAQMAGEVRTIRAVVYFEMQKRYGGVPLVDVVLDPFSTTGIDEQYLRRATEEEIADFVDSELAAAAELLPANPTLANSGQINRYVALAYKARANLWSASVAKFPAPLQDQSPLIGIPASRANEFYGKAIAAADAVIGSGRYSLYTGNLPDRAENYRQIFLQNGNSEVIFERRFDGVNITSNFSYLNVPHPFSAGQGGSHVSLDLLMGFENLDGTLTEPAMGPNARYASGVAFFANKDPRVQSIAFLQGMQFGGRALEVWAGIDPSPAGTANTAAILQNNQATYQGLAQVGREGGRGAQGVWNSNSGIHIRKYMLPVAAGAQHTGTGETTSIKEIRLAEMYLIKAEAAFESGNLGLAATALNMTRQRAGLPPVEQVGGITRQRVRTERMSELALEASRYWDFRRWRIAEAELHTRTFRGLRTIRHFADNNYYFLASTSVNTGGEDGSRQFLPHFYYNPMTENRIAANPLLVENPGY